jgi:hypothetical protein
MVACLPAGAASSRSCRLAPKTRIASASARSRSAFISSSSRCSETLIRQVQRTVSASHLSAGRPWSTMPKRRAMRASQGLGVPRSGPSEFAVEDQRQLQQALVAAAEERQGAMRGDRQDRFRVGEVVLELGGFAFLAGDDRRLHAGRALRGRLRSSPSSSASSENCSIRIWRAPSRTLLTSAKPASALR